MVLAVERGSNEPGWVGGGWPGGRVPAWGGRRIYKPCFCKFWHAQSDKYFKNPGGNGNSSFEITGLTYPLCVTSVCLRPSFLNISTTVSIGV